ncbi:hypothetical protein ANCDUO_01632 [Ancylostoma duodenale]|uniref:Peptidase M13 C-terminal domain-containing protein n=1 Tax=Ancylostoma duodenale TaxID=51022 RepID=A0A0C2H2L6_9BILA|nr:hypothetical protein ANCDUO_01632 [Ancylostoma duodenale]
MRPNDNRWARAVSDWTPWKSSARKDDHLPNGVYVDPHFNFAEWLGPEFYTQFKKRMDCLKKMYDKAKIPGFNRTMIGFRTLEENTADNMGAKLAFKHLQSTSSRF